MDLKEFLENKHFWIGDFPEEKNKFAEKDRTNLLYDSLMKVISVEELGLFFWDRGGKQFAEGHLENNLNKRKKENNVAYMNDFDFLLNLAEVIPRGHNFLDALACLGEDKIKELIKELEK